MSPLVVLSRDDNPFSRHVIAFVAHPDDEVLGVGGTLARHVALGDRVTVHIAGICRSTSDAEWTAVANTLGVSCRRWHEPEHAIWQREASLVIELDPPTIVYTHHGGDINADHRALHEAVMVACRPYAAPSVKSIRTFHTPSSTEWGHGFTPTLYVDISDHIDAKLAAMALYESELRPEPHPRSLEYLKAQAMTWGAAAGFRYAEAFQVERDRW